MPSGRFRFGRATYRRAKGGLPNEQRIQLRNNVESSRTYLYDQLNPKLRPHINQPRMAAVPLTSVEILEQMIHTVDHLALTSLVEMQDVQDLLSSPSLQSVSGQDLSGSLNQGLSISDLDLAQSIVQNPSSENIQACVKAGLDMEKTVRFANSLTPETVAILNDYVDENEGSSSKPVDESLELSHYHSDNAVMVCLPKIHNLLIIGYLHPNNPLAKIKSGLVVIVLLGSALVAIVSNSAMVTLAILGLNYGMQTSWIQNVFDNLVMPSPRKCLPKTSFN